MAFFRSLCGHDPVDDVPRVLKCLLLGTGDSGKTTIFKQIKAVNGREVEKEQGAITTIRISIIFSLQQLIETAMVELALHEDNREIAQQMLERPDMVDWNDPKLPEQIKKLWADPAIVTTYAKRDSFSLDESLTYFIEKIDTIADPKWEPTREDIIRVRQKTTGINEMDYQVEKCKIKVVDVGGQRSERKKWEKVFENTNVILFVVNLSEFDMKVYEDNVTNRLEESLALFEQIANSPLFVKCTLVLIFNKMDVFEEKITNTDNISNLYPDYKDGRDIQKACMYIRQKYMNKIVRVPAKLLFTTATEEEKMIRVWEELKAIAINHKF